MQRFNPVTADFAYIRLLGDHKKMDRLTKTWDKEIVDHTDSLHRWAGVIADLLSKEIPVYVYANNHYAGHAPATLRRLEQSIREVLGEDQDADRRPDLFS